MVIWNHIKFRQKWLISSLFLNFKQMTHICFMYTAFIETLIKSLLKCYFSSINTNTHFHHSSRRFHSITLKILDLFWIFRTWKKYKTIHNTRNSMLLYCINLVLSEKKYRFQCIAKNGLYCWMVYNILKMNIYSLVSWRSSHSRMFSRK